MPLPERLAGSPVAARKAAVGLSLADHSRSEHPHQYAPSALAYFSGLAD
jgi:hypothetical protein